MDGFTGPASPPCGRQFSLFGVAGDGKARETGRDFTCQPRSARDRICVALIEDNCLVREALTMFLNRAPDIRVKGGKPEEHKSILREMDPDVVLLDLALENGDSLGLATQALNDFPDARVIVMDLHPAYENLADFVTAGVSGFVMKDATMDDVLGTIRAVAAGLKVVPDQITDTLFSAVAREPAAPGRVENQDSECITPREREVTDLVAEGLSNKAIAKELHISIHTVKSHLRNVMDKLSVHSRLQLAKHVYEHAAPAQPPQPNPSPQNAASLAGSTTATLSERTAPRSGAEAPVWHSRSGAERSTVESWGRSRRRTRPHPRIHGDELPGGEGAARFDAGEEVPANRSQGFQESAP